MVENRKSAETIKQDILKFLLAGSFSVKKISEDIKSNWGTVNKHIEKLKEEGKVNFFFNGNTKICHRTDYPVFFNLSLNKKQLSDSCFLIKRIYDLWKENKKEIPSKTTVQKVAIDVIKSCNLEVPTTRYNFGKVVPIAIKDELVNLDIYITKAPKNAKEIEKEIINQFKTHTNIAWKERKTQYENDDNLPEYLEKEKLTHAFITKEITSLDRNLTNLFLKLPNTGEQENIFELFHEYIEIVPRISKMKDFKKQYFFDTKETFSSLWDLLTTSFFFEDYSKINDNEILHMQKKLQIHVKTIRANEQIENLKEYLKELSLKDILDKDKETMQIMNILSEGLDEK